MAKPNLTVPKEVWQRMKARAATRDITVNDAAIEAFRLWLREGGGR